MTAPLIETVDLIRHFSDNRGLSAGTRRITAVAGVSVQLAQGETLGIAGESGCGKSTLAKMIMGLIPPSSGEVRFRGTPLASMTRHELTGFRRSVQMIFQDPFSSLNPRMRIGEIIGEPLKIHGIISGSGVRERVLELMHQVGLSPDHLLHYPHEFSGGQRQRIGIARALAVAPQVIVADEPVSALDLSIQAQIINLLLELKEQIGLSFIFIAHDLSVVHHMSDRIAIMYLGNIVEIGPRDAVFHSFLHPYTEALISAIPSIHTGSGSGRIILSGDVPSPSAIPAGCPFNSRCRYALNRCREEMPQLEEKKPGHSSACHFSNNLFR